MRAQPSLALLGALALAGPVFAGELIDAILDADPRARITSGSGVAYGSAYAPEPPEGGSVLLDPSAVPSLPVGLGPAFDGARSPLYDLQTTATPERAVPSSTHVPEIPLGRPDAREGVWYQEDLTTP
ncbi:MAG TPA: hypothetical protein VGB20_06530 [bacterium]